MTDPLTESALTMARRKPRSLAISLAYRLFRAARFTFGARRLLRFLLHASWLTWRFAFELSSDVLGAAFQRDARGLPEELLREVIPSGGTVLDAGCGPGRWTRVAARHAGHVVGVDASAAQIEEARKQTSEPNVEYIAGDLLDILSERKFDVALVIHVLEHIEDPDSFLQQIAAAAGTLVIEVPNFEADPLNPVRVRLGCRFYTDADHVREYTAAILRDQLLRNHLEIVREEQHRGSIVAVARRSG